MNTQYLEDSYIIDLVNNMIDNNQYYYKENEWFELELTPDVYDILKDLSYNISDIILYDNHSNNNKQELYLEEEYVNIILRSKDKELYIDMFWLLEDLGIDLNTINLEEE